MTGAVCCALCAACRLLGYPAIGLFCSPDGPPIDTPVLWLPLSTPADGSPSLGWLRFAAHALLLVVRLELARSVMARTAAYWTLAVSWEDWRRWPKVRCCFHRSASKLALPVFVVFVLVGPLDVCFCLLRRVAACSVVLRVLCASWFVTLYRCCVCRR